MHTSGERFRGVGFVVAAPAAVIRIVKGFDDQVVHELFCGLLHHPFEADNMELFRGRKQGERGQEEREDYKPHKHQRRNEVPSPRFSGKRYVLRRAGCCPDAFCVPSYVNQCCSFLPGSGHFSSIPREMYVNSGGYSILVDFGLKKVLKEKYVLGTGEQW